MSPLRAQENTATALYRRAKLASEAYVRCLVSLGFQDTEFYVVVDDSSAFVNRMNVKVEQQPDWNREVEGQVLAYIVAEKPGQALIELPGEAVVGGLRTWVARDKLTAVR